jgi:toxin ParE1/3/4
MSDSARLYRFSLLAERDLEDIWLYTFENWPVEQADRYQNQIMAAIEGLADGSRQGRAIDDIRPGYRKLAVRSHLLFYRSTDTGVIDVIRILHQRMDVSAHLGGSE